MVSFMRGLRDDAGEFGDMTRGWLSRATVLSPEDPRSRNQLATWRHRRNGRARRVCPRAQDVVCSFFVFRRDNHGDLLAGGVHGPALQFRAAAATTRGSAGLRAHAGGPPARPEAEAS